MKQLRTAGVNDVVVLHVREKRERNEPDCAETIQERMQQINAELEYFGFAVRSLVADGNPAATIDRVAEEQDISLIVVGMQGEDAAGDVRSGGVPGAVIRRVSKPILMIRPLQVAMSA